MPVHEAPRRCVGTLHKEKIKYWWWRRGNFQRKEKTTTMKSKAASGCHYNTDECLRPRYQSAAFDACGLSELCPPLNWPRMEVWSSPHTGDENSGSFFPWATGFGSAPLVPLPNSSTLQRGHPLWFSHILQCFGLGICMRSRHWNIWMHSLHWNICTWNTCSNCNKLLSSIVFKVFTDGSHSLKPSCDRLACNIEYFN